MDLREIGFRVVGTGSRSCQAFILSVLNLRILLLEGLLVKYMGKGCYQNWLFGKAVEFSVFVGSVRKNSIKCMRTH
jgi:hypothetical protein